MPSGKLYCIRRCFGESPHYFRDVRPDGRFVAAFLDRDEAESHLRGLESHEHRTRTDVNPFLCCPANFHGRPQRPQPLAEVTSLDEPRLCNWVLDLGLTPPDPDPTATLGGTDRPWVEWWEEQVAAMNELQRQRVWEALDRARLFELVEVERNQPRSTITRKVYVVQRREWRFNDRWVAYDAKEDDTLLAFTNREAAVAYRDQLAGQLGFNEEVDPHGEDVSQLVVVEIEVEV